MVFLEERVPFFVRACKGLNSHDGITQSLQSTDLHLILHTHNTWEIYQYTNTLVPQSTSSHSGLYYCMYYALFKYMNIYIHTPLVCIYYTWTCIRWAGTVTTATAYALRRIALRVCRNWRRDTGELEQRELVIPSSSQRGDPIECRAIRRIFLWIKNTFGKCLSFFPTLINLLKLLLQVHWEVSTLNWGLYLWFQ